MDTKSYKMNDYKFVYFFGARATALTILVADQLLMLTSTFQLFFQFSDQ